MPRIARPVHLVFAAEPRSAAELAEALLGLIASGAPADGDWLPATRALAQELGCSRAMVTAAYDELVAAGFLDAIPGSGTRVAEGARDAVVAGVGSAAGRGVAPSEPAAEPTALEIEQVDLLPGRPDASLLDRPEWTRVWRKAALAGLDAVEPWAADLPLPAALAGHLRRQRGIVDADPIVLPGMNAAVRALVAAADYDEVVLEAPCYRQMHAEFVRLGLRVQFVPVDEDGLVVAELPRRRTLVYLTPAHQYPLGHRLSADRRAALIAWAEATDSLVIEDDYDGEFRYGVAALPPLRTLAAAAERVAYIGTASKVMAPSLRVAWLVVPERWRRAVLAVQAEEQLAVPAIVQRALAEFIESGELARHLARAGRVYRDRHDELVAAVRRECPSVELLGVDAGLHVCLRIPGVDDEALAERLAAAGWLVRPLTYYPGDPSQTGVVVNFARADFGQLRGFARALREELQVLGFAASAG